MALDGTALTPDGQPTDRNAAAAGRSMAPRRRVSSVSSDRRTSTPGIDAETRALILPLWDFLAVSHVAETADVIFVFGSGDLAVPDRAAELYHAGYAPRLLVSGHAGRRTRGVFTKPRHWSSRTGSSPRESQSQLYWWSPAQGTRWKTSDSAWL